MTTGIDGLRRRLQMVRKQVDKQHAARQWSFFMAEDEDIPDSIKARWGENDSVYIRRYPKDLLGELTQQDNRCIGYVTWANNTLIVFPDGRLEPVKQQGGTSRRRQR